MRRRVYPNQRPENSRRNESRRMEAVSRFAVPGPALVQPVRSILARPTRGDLTAIIERKIP